MSIKDFDSNKVLLLKSVTIGGEDIKKDPKLRDVIYGWPLWQNLQIWYNISRRDYLRIQYRILYSAPRTDPCTFKAYYKISFSCLLFAMIQINTNKLFCSLRLILILCTNCEIDKFNYSSWWTEKLKLENQHYLNTVELSLRRAVVSNHILSVAWTTACHQIQSTCPRAA
jgi:hypothetical protein